MTKNCVVLAVEPVSNELLPSEQQVIERDNFDQFDLLWISSARTVKR
ncbi:MAG: hypothetical protein ACXADA_15270 [Candidatus Hodarchaeales archaeon]